MITGDLLTIVPLLAAIPDEERASIASRAADVRLEANDWLLQEGEMPAFFMLLSGELQVSKRFGSVDQPLTTYAAGDYFGELPLLLGTTAFASFRATRTSRLARLEASDFRELIVACRVLSGELMQTMALRLSKVQRVMLDAPDVAVTVIGDRWDPACHDVRDFLMRNHVGFHWREPDSGDADMAVPVDATASRSYPVVVLPDGARVVAPSYRDLAERVGLQTMPSRRGIEDRYDVAIIGAGPAGLAAAVYGASEGLKTILFERMAPGGQAGTSSRIENYLGFPSGLSGDDLSARALQQARRFGAEIVVARCVNAVGARAPRNSADARTRGHTLTLDGGECVDVRALIIATGVSWRKLDIPGIDALIGRGVYYGAARAEAIGFRGKSVVLVGGGNSAGQAAMLFADYASKVTLLVRGPSLEASMSQYLISQLATKANIHVALESEVVALEGSAHLEAIVVEHGKRRERSRHEIDGLFIFIGARAETEWLPAAIIRDELGYVCTGRDVMDLVAARAATGASAAGTGVAEWSLERDPYLLETSVPGIFAVGDVRHGSIKRVASGVGEGSMSIAFVHQYLAQSG